MNETNYWNNKNVLITGGTSGLGRALTVSLLGLGARVAIIARHRDRIDALVNEYPQTVGIQGDVSDKNAIVPIAGEVRSRLGDVDILINSASSLGSTPLRLLIDTECEDFGQVLETNLLGPFRLTKAILPSMLLKGSGLVINISSDAAISAYPTWGAYSVSKAGLDHMSRIFDAELAAKGVHFLAVDPGDMNTPMHFEAIPNANPKGLRDPKDAALRIINMVVEQNFETVRRTA